MSRILGLGLALPDHCLEPEQGRRALATIWPHLRGAATEPVVRYLVEPIEVALRPRPLGERMRIYSEWAPRLAQRAAEQALERAGVLADEIDLLVSVSCTGYLVPSLDVELAERLGMRADLVRLPLTELGCSGGGAALALAHRHLGLAPRERVLVVCVELCSLTFHPEDASLDNLTAALVFGDGAGAAVLGGGEDGFAITQVGSRLLPGSRHLLGFDLRDDGFHPVLDRRLPQVLERELGQALAGWAEAGPNFYAVHAGGPRIFAAVERALGLPEAALAGSRSTFRRYGNLSSASLLFVLEELWGEARGRGLALAFGPGVSLELAALRAPRG